MIGNMIKTLCLLAITLIASGCGSSNNEDSAIMDPQVSINGVLIIDDTASTELTSSTDISDSIATPVVSVSSGQMDAFINNPLVTVIPAELSRGSSTTNSGDFVTNPLVH